MKQNVNFSDFCDGFKPNRIDNFTYEGKQALFDYLEQLEEDMGEDIEFDVVALCCEYSEYENLEEFQKAYNKEEFETLEDIRDHTTLIEVGNESFIVGEF